jgi:hypothetical protein
MSETCFCREHSGVVEHEKYTDSKLEKACASTAKAHARLDDVEKRFLPSSVFWRAVGVFILIVGGIISYQTHLLGRLIETVQDVDKGQAVITEKIDQIEKCIEDRR